MNNIKLDMKKLMIDLIETLRKCFTDLGFSDTWINWMMQYIMMRSLTIVNNRIGNLFQSEQGIRKGDAVSPDIFIIYVEYLEGYNNFMATQKKFGIGLN